MTDFGDDPSCRATSLLRSAARELMPVVVDMGPDQAKYTSFISSVTGGGQGLAVLEPIAALLLPSGPRPFRIVPTGDGADWSVSASEIRMDGPSRACVDLSLARAFSGHGSSPSGAVYATDLLVLVIPGGLNDEAYVFPVQRVGADVCEIRCSAPLAPGVNFSCVELVGDRRLLRRAAAQVLDVVPWYMADGTKSFSCRLSLGDESVDADAAYDLVTDAAEVRRLLQVASAMRVTGWFEAPGYGRGPLCVLEIGKDAASFMLNAPVNGRGTLPRSVRVGLELFAMTYELDVRALTCDGGQLRTALPLILRRRRRHRRDQRIAVEPSLGVALSFRNPVTGAIDTRRVQELSFFAASFEFDPATAVLWRGLPLEQAQITWGERMIHVGDVIVEQCAYDASSGHSTCVVSITHASIADDPDMIRLMATLAHPRVRTHDGADFAALHQTYLKAGLFGPHMHRNLDPMVEQTKLVWRKAHSEAADVLRTFVHGPRDAPDAAVTVMRAWEYGWVAQHFINTSPDLNSGTGQLQTALLDHLVPRPDGRYLLFFVKTDNRIMNAYLRRFFATTGTPDAVSCTTVELWSRKRPQATAPRRTGDIRLRRCLPSEELLVSRAAQRCFGPQAAAALSMLPNEISLPDTRERFARAGLERTRGCDLVLRDDEPVYALLEERATPGLNLTWMLNACWIVPIHPANDHDGAALECALESLVERPPQTVTGERFLNLPQGFEPATLERWGFSREAAVFLYVMTRAGLHRFFHYATSRHGELDALTARRERRRESRSPRG
jgi:hypothetical protein